MSMSAVPGEIACARKVSQNTDARIKSGFGRDAAQDQERTHRRKRDSTLRTSTKPAGLEHYIQSLHCGAQRQGAQGGRLTHVHLGLAVVVELRENRALGSQRAGEELEHVACRIQRFTQSSASAGPLTHRNFSPPSPTPSLQQRHYQSILGSEIFICFLVFCTRCNKRRLSADSLDCHSQFSG